MATTVNSIRPAQDADLDGLYRLAAAVGATHEKNYFERCLAEQQDRKRVVMVAEQNGMLTGYVQLVWSPEYAPFKRLAIPEIQDLNVVPIARRQGLGRQLVTACEDRARQGGKTEMGIAVGLHASYGAAQRLYIRMGYIPDGVGACYDDVPVRAGELRPVDDQLTLKFLKTL